MFTFIVVLVLVFVAVDLLVRFVVDPLASKSLKGKAEKKYAHPVYHPTINLVSETMYDGGTVREETNSPNKTDNGDDKKIDPCESK